MKAIKSPLAILSWAVTLMTAQAAPFTNLDFESANTNSSQLQYRFLNLAPPVGPGLFPYGIGLVDQLLPGWQVYIGGQLTNTIAIGNGFLDSPNFGPMPTHASLVVPGRYIFSDYSFSPDGQYALLLDSLHRTNGLDEGRVMVVQTGDVPADAQWFTFRRLALSRPNLIVDGTTYGRDSLLFDPNDPSRLYFDISPWAGKTVSLGFSAPIDGADMIDSVAFIVPEPPSSVLLSVIGFGILAFFIVRRRRKEKHSRGFPINA